ncbi:MAG: smalltalk protein [Bacteroidales bacterium]|nr:smalltalk protein [Bacteroidales bacterium]
MEVKNRELWKFAIQTVINILAAILTALGATGCVR